MVVIGVTQSNEIMDEDCKMFYQALYQNLINNETIRDSYNKAIESIRKGKDHEIPSCCCAHKHDRKDCKWYKLYQEDPKRAHDLHSWNTCCNSENKVHEENCLNLKEFNKEVGKQDDNKRLTCCCRDDLKHDNTIKYSLNFKEDDNYSG